VNNASSHTLNRKREVSRLNNKSYPNWIAGDLGAKRIDAIAKTLRTKILGAFNDQWGTGFDTYTPWMTALTVDPKKALILYERPSSDMVLNPDYLKAISEVFLNQEHRVLSLSDHQEMVRADHDVAQSQPWFASRMVTAKSNLFSTMPWLAALYPSVVQSIVPVRLEGLAPQGRFAFSHHLAKGAIFMQVSSDETSFAPNHSIDLAHEIGHQVLMTYLSADPLITSDPKALIYSGARGVERTAHRSLHSAVALAYMVMAGQGLIEHDKVPIDPKLVARLNDWQLRLITNLGSLRSACTFSVLGAEILADLESIADKTGGLTQGENAYAK